MMDLKTGRSIEIVLEPAPVATAIGDLLVSLKSGDLWETPCTPLNYPFRVARDLTVLTESDNRRQSVRVQTGSATGTSLTHDQAPRAGRDYSKSVAILRAHLHDFRNHLPRLKDWV